MPAVALSTTSAVVVQADNRRTSLTLTNSDTDIIALWGFSSAEVIHEIYPREHFTMTFRDGFEPRNGIHAKSASGTPTLLVDSGYLNEDLLRHPWEPGR